MTAQDEEKPQVSGGEEVRHVNLKVLGSDGTEIAFKIKRTTPMERLMNAYVSKTGVDPKAIRFLIDGNRIQGTQTPDDLDLEDGDQIETAVQQLGGC